MSLIIFQSLIILFALFTIVNIFRLRRQGALGIWGVLFWVLFWIGVSLVVLWPQGVQMIARTFGIGRGSDFVLYISVITLFFLLFRLHIKIESIGREVTRVVRTKAIDEMNKK